MLPSYYNTWDTTTVTTTGTGGYRQVVYIDDGTGG